MQKKTLDSIRLALLDASVPGDLPAADRTLHDPKAPGRNGVVSANGSALSAEMEGGVWGGVEVQEEQNNTRCISSIYLVYVCMLYTRGLLSAYHAHRITRCAPHDAQLQGRAGQGRVEQWTEGMKDISFQTTQS